MLALLLALQVAAPVAQQASDSQRIYSSPAVQALVTDASRLNRRVPPSLAGYRASAESEIGILSRRSEGNEGAVSVEQTQSDVVWTRSGDFEQRVVGYRSQAIGLQFSTLSFFRQSWIVPVLYGNRLTLLFGRDTSRARLQRRRPQDPRLIAVHPLAEDRELVYRFTGGDTLVTMRSNGREIPIVRIVAEPRDDAPDSTVAFRGELDLDATRHVLVRMRGYFVRKAPPPSLAARIARLGRFEAVAFVELENGEIEGRYWLPSYQRFEAQASFTAMTDSRSVFRIVTRFRDHAVRDTLVDTLHLAEGDTLRARPFPLVVAPQSTLARADGWRRELGEATSAVHSDDFNDIGPDVWRPTGRPSFAWRAQRVMDVVHYNRVDGVYTGYGAEWRLRDAAPGLTLRGNAGVAWNAQTVRGRLGAEWKRGGTTYIARAGRMLDLTNDFRSVFDSGSSIGAVFGADNYDYVDRRLAAVGLWRQLGKGRTAVLRMETGPARDRMLFNTVSRGIFRGDSGFRPNRNVRAGNYWRHWAALDWHPDVSADLVSTGIGGSLIAEAGRGALSYTRLEARLMGRKNAGPFTIAARGDVGTLLGNRPPPQQLFELGNNQNLPGYDYKEFAGSEAAVVRGLAMYRLGLLQTPIRLGRLLLPPLAPALAAGVQSGWTRARTAGARQAIAELDPDPSDLTLQGSATVFDPPLSRPTDGFRTTVTTGLRLFGGAIGVGMARAVDRKANWKLVFEFSQGL